MDEEPKEIPETTKTLAKIMAFLKQKNPVTRSERVLILLRVCPDVVIDMVIAAVLRSLRSASNSTYSMAVLLLTEIGPLTMPPLETAFRISKDLRFRTRIVRVFASIVRPEAVAHPFLVRCLLHAEKEIREAAMGICETLGLYEVPVRKLRRTFGLLERLSSCGTPTSTDPGAESTNDRTGEETK